MGIHLRLGGDDWGIIFTWDSFQPSTPANRSGTPAKKPGSFPAGTINVYANNVSERD